MSSALETVDTRHRTAPKLTAEQHARMYELLEAGKETHVAIARLFGVTSQSVDAFAKRRLLPPKLALRAQGYKFVQDWIRASDLGSRKGLHAAAKDGLLHGGHIEPMNTGSNQQIVVQIGVQLRGAGGSPMDDQPQQTHATIMPLEGEATVCKTDPTGS